MTAKAVKITVVKQSALEDYDFKAPSKYYFINAIGEAVFIHARVRADADKYITENYGRGFYSLRTSSLEKNDNALTCTGTATRAKPSSRQP
jgi:hypothetical protein